VRAGNSNGANQVGALTTITSGRATGNVADGDILFQTGVGNNTSNSTLHTLTERLRIVGKVKVLSNTSATLTNFATITGLAALTGCGGKIFYTISAASATQVDTAVGHVDFTVINNNTTTWVATLGTVTDVKANTAGAGSITSGMTLTAPAAGSVANFNVTPVFTTIVPTSVFLYYTIILNGAPGAVWNVL
jgi:hypothetical protein